MEWIGLGLIPWVIDKLGNLYAWLAGRPRVEVRGCSLGVKIIDDKRRGWQIDAVLFNRGKEPDELLWVGICPKKTQGEDLHRYPRYAPGGRGRILLPRKVPTPNHSEIHDSPDFPPSQPFAGRIYYQFTKAGVSWPRFVEAERDERVEGIRLPLALAVIWEEVNLQHLRDTEPYVQFNLYVFNGSLFGIIFEREYGGEILLNEKPLQSEPRLVEGFTSTWRRGSTAKLTVRQPVTRETANNVLSHSAEHTLGAMVRGFSLSSFQFQVRGEAGRHEKVAWVPKHESASELFMSVSD